MEEPPLSKQAPARIKAAELEAGADLLNGLAGFRRSIGMSSKALREHDSAKLMPLFERYAENVRNTGGCRAAFGEIRYSMIVRPMTIIRATIFLLWIIVDAAAYVQGYLPLTEQELSLRFPQHVVRKQFLPLMGSPEVVKIGSTTVRFLEPDTNTIQFSGKDSAGKPWTVAANGWMGGALYTADLDHNGTTDIIFASFTGGNGWAPPMHVLTLLFQADGRPRVSEMDGYFETDARAERLIGSERRRQVLREA